MKTLTLTPAAAQLLVMLLEYHANSFSRALRRRFWWPRKVRPKDVDYAQKLALIQSLLEQLRKE